MATISLTPAQQKTYDAGAAKFGVQSTSAPKAGTAPTGANASYYASKGFTQDASGGLTKGATPVDHNAAAPTTPGAVPPVSPTVPNPSPTTVQASTTLPGSPAGNIKLDPIQQASYDAAIKTLGSNGKPMSPTEQGFNNAKKSGTPPPQDGGANGNTKDLMPPDNTPPQTTPAVDNFMAPDINKSMAEQVKTLMDIVSPQATRDNLTQEMSKLTDEKNTLAKEKLQLMNVKNVMAGTEQDIRDEVTKANGFATNSQVLALSVARNATLLKDASFLQDQLNAQQDLINNDTTLLASDKADAASQLSTRMGLMNYIQTNQNNQANAFRQNINTQINTPGGLTALASDPKLAANAETHMGWAPGTIASMEKAAKSDTDLKHQQLQATINNILATTANTRANTAKTLNDTQNASAPLALKDYTTTTSTGKSYVDLSTVSDKTEKKNVEAAARAQGIPVVTDANAAKMNAIEDTRNNLDNIAAQFDKIGYSSGLTKALGGFGLSNRVKDAFGNTDIGSFKAWRTAAINSVQALAGGAGSGLRINAAEIDAATKNDIPNIGDTVAVGKAKMEVLRSQLNSWEGILTGSKDRSGGAGVTGGTPTDPLGLGI